MEQTQFFEYLFRAIITVGVGAVVYNLRDFKSRFEAVTIKLTDVSYGLQAVIENSRHRDKLISELKKDIEANEAAIITVKERLIKLELRE